MYEVNTAAAPLRASVTLIGRSSLQSPSTANERTHAESPPPHTTSPMNDEDVGCDWDILLYRRSSVRLNTTRKIYFSLCYTLLRRPCSLSLSLSLAVSFCVVIVLLYNVTYLNLVYSCEF